MQHDTSKSEKDSAMGGSRDEINGSKEKSTFIERITRARGNGGK